jgi:hypothetical protein
MLMEEKHMDKKGASSNLRVNDSFQYLESQSGMLQSLLDRDEVMWPCSWSDPFIFLLEYLNLTLNHI